MDDLTRLLTAARDGDDDALVRWLRLAQPEVWRLCAHLVDSGSADDLTQETLVRAYRALPGFRGDSSARTWVLSIARRTCVDEIRRLTRRRRLHSMITPVVSTRLDSSIEVDDLLAGLDDDRRLAFTLTQILGLSYAEAAEVSGCAVGTIRSRVARARTDLIAAIDDSEIAGNF